MTLSGIAITAAAVAPFFLLTVWALVDAGIRQFPGGMREKAVWWIIALLPFIGWLIYLLFGLRRGKRPGPAS